MPGGSLQADWNCVRQRVTCEHVSARARARSVAMMIAGWCECSTGCVTQSVCSGASVTCPVTSYKAMGSPCDDGNACTGPDTCTATYAAFAGCTESYACVCSGVCFGPSTGIGNACQCLVSARSCVLDLTARTECERLCFEQHGVRQGVVFGRQMCLHATRHWHHMSRCGVCVLRMCVRVSDRRR
jgi:hypothetical protein